MHSQATSTVTAPVSRNYGIDMLRIVAMMMVVMLHTLGQGGILSSVTPGTPHYHIAWLLEIACFCSVNCYALISGYVLFDKHFAFSKLLHLWLIIVFYSLTITLIMIACGLAPFDKKLLMVSIVPIIKGHYWYLTAYFGVYLLSPLFNAAIQGLDRALLKKLFLVGFILIVSIPAVLERDPFCLQHGYSMIWLSLLYVVGAYLKKYDDYSQKKSLVLDLCIFLGAVLVTYLTKLLLPSKEIFISFASPTMVVAAIAVFNLCRRIAINGFIKKIICLFAPAALSVYIIHVHPLIWNNYLRDFSISFVNESLPYFIAKVIASVLLIWFVCSIIDLIRLQLFKGIRVRQFCERIESTLTRRIFHSKN